MAYRLHAKDDIVQYGKTFYKLEVLMHHTDSQRIGIVRVFDLDFFAVFADLSFFRLVQTK